MRLRFRIIAAILLAAPAGLAQSVRMSPDFLPLEVGNLWRYEVTDPSGAPLGSFEMEVLQHAIVDGVSLYVFSRFPLAGEGGTQDPIAIRFDEEARSYVYTDGSTQGDLFPAAGVEAEVMERDETGLPRIVRLRYENRTLALERGVGIIAASDMTPEGRRIASLAAARVGSDLIGDVNPLPVQPLYPIEEAVDSNVVSSADTAPILEIEAGAIEGGHRFILRIRNPADRLMAFDFTTSQNFDFIVTEAASGREVWQWARRRFFSEVMRAEAIRGSGQWEFEAEWNGRDNDLEEVPAGSYEVRGILTSTNRFESEPIAFEIE